MTKIEKKLKELGYSKCTDAYRKEYIDIVIYIYPPITILKREWKGYIMPHYGVIESDMRIKDLQTAWVILQSDLNEIKKIEEK